MDNYLHKFNLCLFAFLLFAGGSHGQGDPASEVKVHFASPEKVIYTAVGATELQLECVLNQDAVFVTVNSVEIVHINPATKTELIITSAARLGNGANPDNHKVSYKQGTTDEGDDAFHVILTILNVGKADDGHYKCQASYGGKNVSTEVDLVVVSEVSYLELDFPDHPPVTSKPQDPVAVDSDSYQVTCTAVGANPAVEDLTLYLDGVPLEASDVIMNMAKDFRVYNSSITAQVDINVQSSGKDLQCVSKDKSNNAVTTELGIFVNTYDPEIMCNESEAHIGMMDPLLTCMVNHTNIEVESFAFEIGKSGSMIKAGGSNPDNMQVTSKSVSADVTMVTLNLHKATQEHFDDKFYIVIRSKGGHITKEKVVLTKVPRPPGVVGDETDDNDEGDDGDGNSGCVLDARMALGLTLLMSLLGRLL